MTQYSIALYSKQFDSLPYMARGLTWAQVADCIGTHRAFLDKQNDVPMFGPHIIREGQPVSVQNVTAVTFGVLDLDDWSETDIVDLLSDMDERVPYVFATSWSHRGGGMVRGRILYPFSRAVLPSEWPRFWPIFNERYARGRADDKCKDASRRYWVPSFQEGGLAPPLYARNDSGSPIDVDAILLDAAPAGFTGSTTPTRSDLQRLADRWASAKGGRKEHLLKLSRSLRAVTKGDAFAPSGERDNLLFQLCSEIVSRWPTLNADEAAKLFQASLMLMGPDAPTVEKAADIMKRRQRGMVTSRAELIREAFGNDRDAPYTPEELEGFAELLGVPLDRLRRRWIIQRGSTYYVFVDGTYRRYNDTDVVGAVHRDLAPAISAQVDTSVATEKGVRPKTALELVKDYGSVATGIEVDLSAQHPYYDEKTFTMIEAPCPIRVESGEVPEIGRWLELLAGPERHERLLQWIAALTILDSPSAALYVEGAGGTGKTLLASGLARIWTVDRPTALEEAMGDFNESFMRCPLVFGDEVAPLDSRGRLRTDYLREFIQARNRPLKRKYQPNATLRGCARLIMAANNRNLLTTSEHLTENDINAIVERFFYLPIWVPDGCDPRRPPARVYLEQLGQTHGQGYIETWVTQDLLAKHALWLRDTIDVPRTSRFLVSGEASDLTRSLATSTGVRAAVCNWLVGFLLQPSTFRLKAAVKHLVRVNKSRLLVNAKAVQECWTDYVLNDPKGAPTPMQVAHALTGLALSTNPRVFLWHKGHKVAYRNIDLDNLREWAEETQYATSDALAQAIAHLDDESSEGPVEASP